MNQYTLSQVLGIVKQSVDELMGEFRFWCVADVVSIQTKGKFTYLELAELDADGNVVVKTKANIWDSSILTKFTKATGVDHLQLKNQTILFSGRVSFHTLYGFSLVIDELSSEYTKGALATSQQKIVEELTKEGIINKNKLTAISFPPFSLAVVSGQTSAGMTDFFAILKDAKLAYTVQNYPCAIQGNQAKQEVYEQLQQIKNDIEEGKEYSMVCIMRGGGGTSDMLRQNDIDIAREICAMPIPVLVAVGHTQDSSVLEHVAWSHAKTPSEAAYLIIQEYDTYTDSITSLYEAICHTTELIFSRYRVDIPHVMNAIIASVQQAFATIQESVHSLYESISLYHPNTILAQGYALVRKNDMLLRGKDVTELKADDTISIETYTSTIYARVESIETKE